MQSRLLHEADGQRIFVVVLGTGDEVLSSSRDFVERERIHTAAMTAIGTLSDATLLYFNWETKTYDKIPVHERVEVASLIGDVAEAQKANPRSISISCWALATAAPRPDTSAQPMCGRRWK
jgi:predicted DNA-binding protein with PD1-like motif